MDHSIMNNSDILQRARKNLPNFVSPFVTVRRGSRENSVTKLKDTPKKDCPKSPFPVASSILLQDYQNTPPKSPLTTSNRFLTKGTPRTPLTSTTSATSNTPRTPASKIAAAYHNFVQNSPAGSPTTKQRTPLINTPKNNLLKRKPTPSKSSSVTPRYTIPYQSPRYTSPYHSPSSINEGLPYQVIYDNPVNQVPCSLK